jgi:hypothetical protein
MRAVLLRKKRIIGAFAIAAVLDNWVAEYRQTSVKPSEKAQ